MKWQGRRDSNPQPMVLETTTLPIELQTYRARVVSCIPRYLPGFLVYGVLSLKWAVLLDLHPPRMLPLVLGPRVVASLTRRTLEDYLFSWHRLFPLLGCSRRPSSYSTISVTTPAPTVRPPSRIANRSSFSIATGAINSTSSSALSPGMIISTPSASLIEPVTSVVRK